LSRRFSFKTQSFHINTGPGSLFTRVRYKMSGRRTLRMHAGHFEHRSRERNITQEILNDLSDFDAKAWDL
jgi:hypothetical protein